MISPHFSDDKLNDPSFDDLVDVFENRVRWWILEPARTLLGVDHGFVAAMSLLMAYFEGYQQYRTGSTGPSKKFFREGFADVFANAKIDPAFRDRLADALYEDARCGFFHDGMFRDRILFSNQFTQEFVVTVRRIGGKPDPTGPIESILVNPGSFHHAIEVHFLEYVKALRDPSNTTLRAGFKATTEAKWSPSTAIPIGMTEEEFTKGRS
jgi:hypothetical protein